MCRRNSQATGIRPDEPLKHASAPRPPADRVMATSLCPSTVKGAGVAQRDWTLVNPGGSRRVVVTKELPGERRLQLLIAADRRVEIACGDDFILVPHLGSASTWTRGEGTATLAAANAALSIVNADHLNLRRFAGQAPTKEDQQ